jgi:hypothetical protein
MSESLVIGRKTFSDFYRAQARNFGEMTKTTHDAREIEDVVCSVLFSPFYPIVGQREVTEYSIDK